MTDICVQYQNNARGRNRLANRGRGRGRRARANYHNRAQQRPQIGQRVWVAANNDPPQVPQFTGQPGVLVNTQDFVPSEYFQLYVDEDFLNFLVIETNRYAEQYIRAHPELPPHSRVRAWQPVNRDEMKHFLGLTLLMGIVQKPRINLYWSTDPLLSSPIFSAVMSRDRYLLSLKFLHFNDNTNAPDVQDPNRDRLYKVRPVLDHFF